MTILARSRSGEHVLRNELAAGVVAVGIVGQQNTKAVADGEAGRDDQKAAGEFRAAGAANGIDGLPGNEHGHDGGLAGSGGEFQRKTHELGVGVIIGIGQMIEETLAGFTAGWGDFGQPDSGFDGLQLAKERANVVEFVAAPMLQKMSGFGRYLPIVRIRPASPLVDMMAKFVDDGGGRIVLLFFRREPFAFVEYD